MSCVECEELRTAHANVFHEYEDAKRRYAESVLGPSSRDVFIEKRLLEDTMDAYTKLAAIDGQLSAHRCDSHRE